MEQKEQMIQEIKNKLQEYWVNEVHLPLGIQIKSMAIMDIIAEKY